MNIDRDLDTRRIVRSWLRTDEHESADRVLDNVLALLDATPQHRTLPVRRFADMNSYMKLAMTAAAVVVVAVVGINVLPRGGVAGGPPPSPSPSPSISASPSISPAQSATAPTFPPKGVLAVGKRHAVALDGKTVTFTVATDDWFSNGEFAIAKTAGMDPHGAEFIFWSNTPHGMFRDPCRQATAPAIGTDPGELAAGVTTVPGVEVVDQPADVVVGGYPGKRVAIRIPDDIGCPAQEFHLWWAPGDTFGRYASKTGSTIRTWIIDVDGTTVWFDAETYEGAGPEPGEEIQAIVDSMEFE